jgi:hypothetical protein
MESPPPSASRDETPQMQVQIFDTTKQDQIKSILQEFFVADEKINQTKAELAIVKKAWKGLQGQIIDFMGANGLTVLDTHNHGKVNLKNVSKKESMTQDFIKSKLIESKPSALAQYVTRSTIS